MKNKSIFGIIVFYIITISLRYLTNKTDFLSEIEIPFFKIILQGISPAIGALVAVKTFNLKFSMNIKGIFPKAIIPLIIFWIFPILIIATKAYFTKDTFPYVTVLAILVYGLLEEIGWRGFLQEQLNILPRFWNILIIAILWFIWHLNFELNISNLIFFFILILGSWGIDLVANKTKSLLAVASFHSLNNFYSEWNLLNLSIVGILVLVWVSAIIYIQKKDKPKTE